METIDYQELVEEALLGMVRRVLARVAEEGLPGEHHFYLTFATDAPGVELPESLRAEYPEQMTVVLRHQFWDLEVEEDGFGVTLSFAGARRRLWVPFAALLGFFDPSVRFVVRFGAGADGAGADGAERGDEAGEATEDAGEEAEDELGLGADNVVRFDRSERE